MPRGCMRIFLCVKKYVRTDIVRVMTYYLVIQDNMPQCTEMSGKVSACPRFQRNAFCFKLSETLSKGSQRRSYI